MGKGRRTTLADLHRRSMFLDTTFLGLVRGCGIRRREIPPLRPTPPCPSHAERSTGRPGQSSLLWPQAWSCSNLTTVRAGHCHCQAPFHTNEVTKPAQAARQQQSNMTSSIPRAFAKTSINLIAACLLEGIKGQKQYLENVVATCTGYVSSYYLVF